MKRSIILAGALAALLSGAALAQEAPIDSFRSGLEAQDAAAAAAGFNLKMYESVELVEEKTARVVVTEDWMRVIAPADPDGNLNGMFDNWRFAHGADAIGVTLIVIAPDGSVVREMRN